jgi:hypothetical protein
MVTGLREEWEGEWKGEALDRLYRAQVGAHLSGMRPTPAFVEDVPQALL